MKRMFFHNQHDIKSTEMLDSLEGEVVVYDVFARDKIPADIKLTTLPYLIDKYISFTPGTYVANEPFALQFKCMDYLDNPVNETGKLRVVVGDMRKSAVPENGVLQVEVVCEEEQSLPVTVTGPGYLPLNTQIEVVAGAAI